MRNQRDPTKDFNSCPIEKGGNVYCVFSEQKVRND